GEHPDERRADHREHFPSRSYPVRMRTALRSLLAGALGLTLAAAPSHAVEKSRKSRLEAAPDSRYAREPISLALKAAALKDVLRTFAELTKVNIPSHPDLNGS